MDIRPALFAAGPAIARAATFAGTRRRPSRIRLQGRLAARRQALELRAAIDRGDVR
ncbi:MAG: hypothetical protein MZV65_16910 [Chromatiales bacterium]|nr:hypothetical protein [Chromatiales bacterium]